MSIIENYKKEAAKGLAQTIALFDQSQDHQDTSKGDINLQQDRKLIEEIDQTTVQESSRDYEAEQFEYFAKVVKTKPSKCVVCNKAEPKYTCPKCRIKYCSIAHYKSHNLFCTQNFFKTQVQDQLKRTKANKQQKKKMIEMMKTNQEKMVEDEDQLMQEVKVEEISEERLHEILKMVENEEEVKLSESESKCFDNFLKEIQFANMQKEGSNIEERNQKENQQELNPFSEYQPFWLIEEGLQQYFLLDSPIQVEDYNNSKHQDIIDYRQLASQLLREDLSKIGQLINFNKISPYVNYELIQVVYLTALLFRSYNGEYLKHQEFIDTFLSIYDENLAKKLAEAHPQSLFENAYKQISITVQLKSNLQKVFSSKKDIAQILLTWLPFILEDCRIIFKNKHLCIETLFRILEAFRSISIQLTIKWTDEAMKGNKQAKAKKLTSEEKQKQKSLIKIIKKIQFLLAFANQIVYSNHNLEESQLPAIKRYNNREIIQQIITFEIQRQKQIEEQIQAQTAKNERQKQVKLKGILIPKQFK